jgi:hypothetical protein
MPNGGQITAMAIAGLSFVATFIQLFVMPFAIHLHQQNGAPTGLG